MADCVDDQGVPFALYQRTGDEERPPATGARPGDLAYVTLEVADAAQARAFYGGILGWRFTPGRVPDGWNVEDVSPMVGMHGGHQQSAGVPMYRVDDVVALQLRLVRHPLAPGGQHLVHRVVADHGPHRCLRDVTQRRLHVLHLEEVLVRVGNLVLDDPLHHRDVEVAGEHQ